MTGKTRGYVNDPRAGLGNTSFRASRRMISLSTPMLFAQAPEGSGRDTLESGGMFLGS
jgi:hypothetical protein